MDTCAVDEYVSLHISWEYFIEKLMYAVPFCKHGVCFTIYQTNTPQVIINAKTRNSRNLNTTANKWQTLWQEQISKLLLKQIFQEEKTTTNKLKKSIYIWKKTSTTNKKQVSNNFMSHFKDYCLFILKLMLNCPPVILFDWNNFMGMSFQLARLFWLEKIVTSCPSSEIAVEFGNFTLLPKSWRMADISRLVVDAGACHIGKKAFRVLVAIDGNYIIVPNICMYKNCRCCSSYTMVSENLGEISPYWNISHHVIYAVHSQFSKSTTFICR